MATDTTPRTPGRPRRPAPDRGPRRARPGRRRPAPRHRARRPARDQARAQARRAEPRARSPRAPFILLLVGLLGGALVSLLVISTTLAQGSSGSPACRSRTPAWPARQQTLTNEVAQAANPAVIAQEGRAARHAAEPAPGLHRPENREDRRRQAVPGRGRDQRARVYPVTPQDPPRRPQAGRRAGRRAALARGDDPPERPDHGGAPRPRVPPGPQAARRSVRARSPGPGPRDPRPAPARPGPPAACPPAATRSGGSASPCSRSSSCCRCSPGAWSSCRAWSRVTTASWRSRSGTGRWCCPRCAAASPAPTGRCWP